MFVCILLRKSEPLVYFGFPSLIKLLFPLNISLNLQDFHFLPPHLSSQINTANIHLLEISIADTFQQNGSIFSRAISALLTHSLKSVSSYHLYRIIYLSVFELESFYSHKNTLELREKLIEKA